MAYINITFVIITFLGTFLFVMKILLLSDCLWCHSDGLVHLLGVMARPLPSSRRRRPSHTPTTTHNVAMARWSRWLLWLGMESSNQNQWLWSPHVQAPASPCSPLLAPCHKRAPAKSPPKSPSVSPSNLPLASPSALLWLVWAIYQHLACGSI